MAANGFTFVDSHVHLWDLAKPWYPSLQPKAAAEEAEELGLGDMSAVQRTYLLEDYLADASGYEVPGFVHVHANQLPGANVAEAGWLAEVAARTPLLKRVVGQVDGTQDAAGIRRELEEQAAANGQFVGTRIVAGIDYDTAPGRELLRTLEEHDWIYDAVAHAGGGVAELARVVGAHEGLSVVLEHAGWPLTREGTFEGWRTELRELAQRPNVVCKVSGFAMWLHRIEESDLRPWVETCVETFGPDRCIVGSNFPVDALWTTFDELLGAYRAITEQYGAEAQQAMFATNVRSTYRF